MTEILTSNAAISPADHREIPAEAAFEAVWIDHPDWPGAQEDPDCGQLTVVLADSPHVDDTPEANRLIYYKGQYCRLMVPKRWQR